MDYFLGVTLYFD